MSFIDRIRKFRKEREKAEQEADLVGEAVISTMKEPNDGNKQIEKISGASQSPSK